MLVFDEGKTGVSGEKPPMAEWRTNNFNPHITPEIEPGPHWWKASALTTTPTLLTKLQIKGIRLVKNKGLTKHVRECKRRS